MTKEELLRHHKEELEDAEKYDKMAEENPEFCQIFHDLAEEERSHAKLIEHVIEHMTV